MGVGVGAGVDVGADVGVGVGTVTKPSRMGKSAVAVIGTWPPTTAAMIGVMTWKLQVNVTWACCPSASPLGKVGVASGVATAPAQLRPEPSFWTSLAYSAYAVGSGFEALQASGWFAA